MPGQVAAEGQPPGPVSTEGSFGRDFTASPSLTADRAGSFSTQTDGLSIPGILTHPVYSTGAVLTA